MWTEKGRKDKRCQERVRNRFLLGYDANGNLTKPIDRLGWEIDYVYDTLNRPTAEKWYDGASLVRTISYTLDAAGRLTQASEKGTFWFLASGNGYSN
jgi:YD repeat-containing protein